MRKNIRLELKIWGAVLDCRIELENTVIGYWNQDPTTHIFYKDLPDYPIAGNLDIHMFSKGVNGSQTTLSVKIAGQNDVVLEGIIENGFSRIGQSITINP